MSIKISQNFDAGAIEVVSAVQADAIELKLRKDSHADIAQWFYFRLQGARDQDVVMRVLNAGDSTYPAGWQNYRAVASYDRENWFRVDTEFDGKVMTISHSPNLIACITLILSRTAGNAIWRYWVALSNHLWFV